MQEKLTLFTQITLVAVISVLSVSQIDLIATEDSTNVDPVESDRLNSQTLEVLPARGQPAPLDQPLQAPRNNSNQEAAGDLQQQQDNLQEQDGDSLQQGATVEDLPEDFDF